MAEEKDKNKDKDRKEKIIRKLNPEILAKHAELNFAPMPTSKEYSDKMSTMEPAQKQALLEDVNKNKTMSNDPDSKKMSMANDVITEKEEPKDPSQELITGEEIDKEEEEMNNEELPDLDPKDKVKESMWGITNFKEAFKYFGPRIGAMILGGVDAEQYTSEALGGYEKSKSAGQNLTDYQKIRLMQAQKRQEQQAAAEEAKQGRFDKAYKLNVKKYERPSGQIMLEQAGQKTMLKHLDALEKLSANVDPSYRGPISGLAKDYLVKFGISDDKDWAAFSARSSMLVNSYIKAITGAQSGSEEQARLGKDVPSQRDTVTVFNAKKDMIRDAIEGRLDAVNSELEKYGYKSEDGSFKGADLSPEMRQQNAAIVSRVIREQLTRITKEAQKNNIKGTKTMESKVPVGKKYMKGGKKYIMTEQGPKEI